jgi:ATPase subunit of ABC transporter with duplicated ATPase domains
LIVDEIDANLDQQAIKVFEEVLRTFSGTVLMVSRFENRLALADHYWHLENGKLKATEISDKKAVILMSSANTSVS